MFYGVQLYEVFFKASLHQRTMAQPDLKEKGLEAEEAEKAKEAEVVIETKEIGEADIATYSPKS